MTVEDIRNCFLGALRKVTIYGFHPYGSGSTAAGYSLTAALDHYYLSEDPPRGVWTACIEYLEHLLGVDPWYWQETQGSRAKVEELLLHGAERAEEVYRFRYSQQPEM